jgi:lipopolysaccharide export LptBFGC system permease protein LptF
MTSSGYSPVRLRVRWHQKLTTPLSVLVLVLIALPFGLNRSGGRRLSTMQGIALALALGIAYNLLLEGLAKAAAASYLPPAVGAWAPIVLGLLFGINRLTTLRT